MNLADRWHSAILKNSLDLMRYEAGLRTEILAMLTQLGRELVGELAQAGLDTPRTDWQRARLRALLDGAQKRIGEGFSDIADHHALNLADAAEASANSLVVALNDAVGVELLQGVKWTPELLKGLVDGTLVEGAPSADWWARQSVDLQEAFADQMRQGILRGETVGQMTARVRDLQAISARNAEALVRTSALAVNNAAQLAAYQENADVIDKLQWTATLDPRTCVRCGAQDGTMWPLGEAHVLPPLHWNCRCITVPITKTWEQLAKKNKALAAQFDEITPGTRASMGGPVSGDTTWESWLGGQPKAVQSEILGPARQKLWDAGKLTITDLVDQRGNALSLAELRAR